MTEQFHKKLDELRLIAAVGHVGAFSVYTGKDGHTSDVWEDISDDVLDLISVIEQIHALAETWEHCDHTHPDGEGEADCAACWVHDIRRIIPREEEE